EATAYSIPYRLIPIEHGQYPRATATQLWADPDFEAAVEALRTVRRDAASRRTKIAAASALVDRAFSFDAYVGRLAARLETLLGREIRVLTP
ncbi:MAG: hypothetical protein GX458_06800, partial [Phyllobacteriaceae bacterium]|nr:hypothetical protein [Phyllobacteriaceae bacterium]